METLVVGDVHGCRDELEELVQRAGAERVILVGDLFTKGPDPGGTWAFIRDHGIEAVLGNHDTRLLKHLEARRAKGSKKGKKKKWKRRRKDRGARRTAKALDAVDRGWRAWLSERPLFLEARPFTVVHAGLHPSGSLEDTTRKMATTMRRWPREKKRHPLWHEIYEGDRRVVFGHDARRGLIRKERQGEPWLIGLDTGCVYGGALSGYLVHADRILQVPAGSAYRPVG